MSSGTRTVKQKTENLTGTRDRNINSDQLEFECQLRTPTQSRIYELLNLRASSSQNLFQALITKQDLLRLREDMWPNHKTLNLFQALITKQDLLRIREDMWPNHKTLRKGWWCRAFATAINRQCPTCNRLWTSEQFPLFKIGNQKEIVTIQTSRQPSGLDL